VERHYLTRPRAGSQLARRVAAGLHEVGDVCIGLAKGHVAKAVTRVEVINRTRQDLLFGFGGFGGRGLGNPNDVGGSLLCGWRGGTVVTSGAQPTGDASQAGQNYELFHDLLPVEVKAYISTNKVERPARIAIMTRKAAATNTFSRPGTEMTEGRNRSISLR
jgi:hypothetical protein